MSFKNVPPDNWVDGTTAAIVDTSETTVVAAITNHRINVTNMHIQNSDASVGTWVLIKCGSTTRWQVYCAAAGGGSAPEFVIPLRGGDGSAWTATCETTSAEVRVSISGYKERV